MKQSILVQMERIIEFYAFQNALNVAFFTNKEDNLFVNHYLPLSLKGYFLFDHFKIKNE